MKNISPLLRTFYVLARQSFLQSLVFRTNFFIGYITEFIFVILSVELWKGIYDGNEAINGYAIRDMVTYMALARLVVSVDMEFVGEVQRRVLSGAVASELLRPISLSYYLIAQEFGRYISRILIRILPIYIIVFITLDIEVPDNVVTVILFAVSVLLSFFIMFYINYSTALMAFWIQQLFSLNVVKNQVVRFLSGAHVALWFFPAFLSNIVLFLPFAMVVFIPIQIYLQKYGLEETFAFIGLQIVWVFITMAISSLIWKRATHRISINGG